jgi:hypothetical protein
VSVTEELETTGLILGRYRLGRRLGAGGFGAVHEAIDETLDRWVAVKVIPADGETPVRARREAVAAARLEHPGIVAIYDAGEEDGARYLVCELVEGRTLAQLQQADELTDRDVLRVGLALCDALLHAHEHGVVHRDVKPQNVLVPDRVGGGGWRGAAKLADFGVAMMVDDDHLTRTGDVVGTLAYMAPEQAAGKRVDHRADLYALALVLYEALAGVNPVRGANPAQTAQRVGKPVPTLAKHRRDLPPELVAAIDTALRVGPAERGTLDDLADALEQSLTEVDDQGGVVSRHPVETAVRIPRGTGRVLHALGAAAVSGGALGWLGASQRWPIAAAIAFAATLLLPRTGWLVAGLGTCSALIVEPAVPAAGTAVALAVAVLPVPLLLIRLPRAWSLPVLAPALGVIAGAGVFPALAGRLRRVPERAAAGALGAWWLLLAEPLAGHPRAQEAASRAFGFQPGELLLCVIWALFAAILPWVVRGRFLAVDLVTGTAWAAGLASATGTLATWLEQPQPDGLVAGAIVAGMLAVVGPRYSSAHECAQEP